jgi:hypothetical protein
MEDPLKSTRSTAEDIMRRRTTVHRNEKATRVSIGAGATSVSAVGKRGIESSRAIDRKREARIVAGRKKTTQGQSVRENSCLNKVAIGKATSGERRKFGLGVRGR